MHLNFWDAKIGRTNSYALEWIDQVWKIFFNFFASSSQSETMTGDFETKGFLQKWNKTWQDQAEMLDMDIESGLAE